MGWQDRDYARPGPHAGTGGYYRGGGLSRPRSVVTILIIVNVGLYVLPRFFNFLLIPIYEWGSMQAGAVLHGQVWRLFTAQYLHDPSGIGHIFVNMLGLHFLGRPLERMWSPRKFFAIYTLCGLGGNVFFTILGAAGVIDPLMPAVGASGCIYGLLGIVAVLFPHATVYIYFLFPLKIRTAAMIFGGIAVLSILSRGENFGGEACHLSGLVIGVWWAYRGDRWWSTMRSRMPQRASRARPVKRGGFADQVDQRRADAETIDRILRKVHDGGIHALSESEKRSLRDATDRQRTRDESIGRADRL